MAENSYRTSKAAIADPNVMTFSSNVMALVSATTTSPSSQVERHQYKHNCKYKTVSARLFEKGIREFSKRVFVLKDKAQVYKSMDLCIPQDLRMELGSSLH